DLDAELLVDGRPVARLRPGRPAELAALAGLEGLFELEAGGLRRPLLLVARGLREGHGAIGWRLDGPAHAAAGPTCSRPQRAGAVTGAVLEGVPAPPRPDAGPWCRMRGTVRVLCADGTCRVVRAPACERWERALGYLPG